MPGPFTAPSTLGNPRKCFLKCGGQGPLQSHMRVRAGAPHDTLPGVRGADPCESHAHTCLGVYQMHRQGGCIARRSTSRICPLYLGQGQVGGEHHSVGRGSVTAAADCYRAWSRGHSHGERSAVTGVITGHTRAGHSRWSRKHIMGGGTQSRGVS